MYPKLSMVIPNCQFFWCFWCFFCRNVVAFAVETLPATSPFARIATFAMSSSETLREETLQATSLRKNDGVAEIKWIYSLKQSISHRATLFSIYSATLFILFWSRIMRSSKRVCHANSISFSRANFVTADLNPRIVTHNND